MSKYGGLEAYFAAAEIDAAIAAQITDSAEADAELNRFMKDEVVPFWRSQTPILKSEPGSGRRRAGAARASVQVTKPARGGQGEVGMKIWYADMLESGTGGATPTPQFAPGGKTAAHFGGTLDRTGRSHGGSDKRRAGAGKKRGRRGGRRGRGAGR
jgi:hypothetical protein